MHLTKNAIYFHMKSYLSIILLITLIAYSRSANAVLPNGYSISAAVASNYITFRFTFNTPSGYIAIGFGRGMTKVDMIVAQLNADKSATVTDRWSVTVGVPKTDVEQGGVDNISFVQVVNNTDGTTSILASRKLVTGDNVTDTDITQNLNDIQFVWLENQPFGFHGQNFKFFKMYMTSVIGAVDFQPDNSSSIKFLEELN